jgi:hypothetical protein
MDLLVRLNPDPLGGPEKVWTRTIAARLQLAGFALHPPTSTVPSGLRRVIV